MKHLWWSIYLSLKCVRFSVGGRVRWMKWIQDGFQLTLCVCHHPSTGRRHAARRRHGRIGASSWWVGVETARRRHENETGWSGMVEPGAVAVIVRTGRTAAVQLHTTKQGNRRYQTSPPTGGPAWVFVATVPPPVESLWVYLFFRHVYSWPLCADVTSSVKPEVHIISQRR